MKLEYIYDKKLPCLDNIIKYISSMENIEYRLFFSASWKFKYKLYKKNVEESIKVDYENNYVMLKDFNGLESKKIYRLNKTERLESLLQQYQYIVVFVDSFYCPWNIDYQRKHSDSDLILINQVNSQKQILYVTDLKYQLFHFSISMKDYQRAALSGIVLKRYRNVRQPTKNDIIAILLKKIGQKQKHFRYFQRFERGLQKSDIQIEFDCTENPWDTMLIKQIGRLIIDRYRYIFFLNYIKENFDLYLDETIFLLESSIENWTIFQNSLIKQMTNRITDTDQNCKRVNKINGLENKAFESLLKTVQI